MGAVGQGKTVNRKEKCPKCKQLRTCVTRVRHWRSGKILKAEDYGLRCFPIGGCRCSHRK